MTDNKKLCVVKSEIANKSIIYHGVNIGYISSVLDTGMVSITVNDDKLANILCTGQFDLEVVLRCTRSSEI